MKRSRAEMIDNVADAMMSGAMIVIVCANHGEGQITVDSNVPPELGTHLLKHGYFDMLARYGDAHDDYQELDCPYSNGRLQSD